MRFQLLAVLIGLLGGTVPPAPPAPSPLPTETKAPKAPWMREDEQWRASRLDRLRAPDGWLTLTGLYWFKEDGSLTFGSAPDNDIVLPQGVPHAGKFVQEVGGVHVVPEGGSVQIEGKLVVGDRLLVGDPDPHPDVLQVGRFRLLAVRRNLVWGIWVKDPESTARRDFKGIEAWPIDPKWRMEATWEPYSIERQLMISTAQGTYENVTSPGAAHFQVDGVPVTLEAIVEEPDANQLLFVFKDATNGKTTYGAGRFLYADLPKDGKIVLDFNRSQNPPSAFTAHATSPLPPFRNRLKVAVEAGEKKYGAEVPLPPKTALATGH